MSRMASPANRRRSEDFSAGIGNQQQETMVILERLDFTQAYVLVKNIDQPST